MTQRDEVAQQFASLLTEAAKNWRHRGKTVEHTREVVREEMPGEALSMLGMLEERLRLLESQAANTLARLAEVEARPIPDAEDMPAFLKRASEDLEPRETVDEAARADIHRLAEAVVNLGKQVSPEALEMPPTASYEPATDTEWLEMQYRAAKRRLCLAEYAPLRPSLRRYHVAVRASVHGDPDAVDLMGIEARQRGVSVPELAHRIKSERQRWLEVMAHLDGVYAQASALLSRGSSRPEVAALFGEVGQHESGN